MWEWQTSYCKLLHTIVGKKSTKKLGSERTHFATDSQYDVQNSWIWWMLTLCENAESWIKIFQNAWIHSLNRFTSQSHSAFRVSRKFFVQIPVWWIHLTTTLWHPKILTQNFTFRKKCWKFVDQNENASNFKEIFNSWLCLEPHFIETLGRN